MRGEFVVAQPENIMISLVLLGPFFVISVEVFLVDCSGTEFECGRSRDHHHKSGCVIRANVESRLCGGRRGEQDRHCRLAASGDVDEEEN